MEENKKKFDFLKESFSLAVIIPLFIFVVFSLVDTLIYYFGKGALKDATAMFSFLSILILSFAVVITLYKRKPLLGSILFLLTLIVDRGLSFIRNLIFASISLSTFDDFYQFLAFVFLVWLVVIIILQLKKAIPNLKFTYEVHYLLPLFVIGYALIFNGFNTTLAIILVFAMLVLFDEMALLGYVVMGRFIFGISHIINFIILKSKLDGYTQSFGFWMNNALMIILFTLGVISVFKPQLFIYKKKEEAPLHDDADVDVVEE